MAPTTPPQPPVDGSLPFVPGFIDFQLRHNSDRPWAVFPSKDNPDKVTEISFLQCYRAMNKLAHHFRPSRKGAEDQVVAVILHTDNLLYVATLLGLIWAGLVPFPMSHRNSVEAICNLLEKTSCHRIVSQPSLISLLPQVQSAMRSKNHPLRIDELPSLEFMFPHLVGSHSREQAELPRYPSPAKPPAPTDKFLYLHSSGSTGLPKAIGFSNAVIVQAMRGNLMRGIVRRRVLYGVMALPPFHALGMNAMLLYPFASGCAIALYTPQYPAPPVVPHPQNVFDACRVTGVGAVAAVPSFIEAWSQSDEAIEFLRTFKILIFGGGPLASKVGDKLVEAGVPLASAYGGTEFGGPSVAFKDTETEIVPMGKNYDWAWLRFAPYVSLKMEPQGDGTYELQLFENDDYILNVHNIPGERGYATSDLLEPHPTKEGLWRVVGRKDDVLVLSTGEKVVTLPQENIITANSMVKGAVMFGREREQAGVLIEPREDLAVDPKDELAVAALRNMVWPIIEESNAHAPAFARIFKEMILVTDPARPLPRAGKGTVQRKLAIALYDEDIKRLYDTVAESADTGGVPPPKTWKAGDIEEWIAALATDVNDGHPVIPTVDLFDQGFDSLSATFLRNRVISGLRVADNPSLQQAVMNISQNFIFEHPTLRQVAAVIATLIDPASGRQQLGRPVEVRVEEMQRMVEKYTAAIAPVPRMAEHPPREKVVLITGSTGNIGSHILASVLADKRVKKVYTIDRQSSSGVSGVDRLETAFADRHLPVDLLKQSKLLSLAGDISKEQFGLKLAQFEEIKHDVTHVIHNAWTVNFNHSLSTFEGQIAGVRKLIDLCGSLDHTVKVFFTSSISVANHWDPARGPVPEKYITDPRIASNTGYSASKYVAERILERAADQGMETVAVRVGQACGSRLTGAWGPTEWFPIMVKTSKSLGCLPKVQGHISWVPVDAVGQMFLDLIVSTQGLPRLVNVVHPRPASWQVIFDGLTQELQLSVIPVSEWVGMVEARSADATPDVLEQLPAIKLLDFYRALARARGKDAAEEVVFSTTELQRFSPTMNNMAPVSAELVRKWVKYWKARHYIDETH